MAGSWGTTAGKSCDSLTVLRTPRGGARHQAASTCDPVASGAPSLAPRTGAPHAGSCLHAGRVRHLRRTCAGSRHYYVKDFFRRACKMTQHAFLVADRHRPSRGLATFQCCEGLQPAFVVGGPI